GSRVGPRRLAARRDAARGGSSVSARAVALSFAMLSTTACGHRPPRLVAAPASVPGSGFLAADTARATAAGASAPLVVASGAAAPGDSLGGRIEAPAD